MDEPAADSGETDCLLELARRGDKQAFEELFGRHHAYLRRVIDLRFDARLQARIDPCDLVQETHLEAFRRLNDYLERRPMPFRLWLRQTACECLQTARRRHLGAQRRSLQREAMLPDQSSLDLARQFVAGGSTPSQRLTRRELVQRVQQALGELAEIDREILIMRNLEQLSNQETAQALEIDPGAASQRYGRALRRLHQRLIGLGLLESES